MITEDCVSPETAKLLKEKGFDLECDYLYVDGEIRRAQGYACNWNSGETILSDYVNECSAPTLQMAMRWLRNTHNLFIDVDWDSKNFYFILITDMVKGDYVKADISGNEYKSYEEACEAAIKYCLENLI